MKRKQWILFTCMLFLAVVLSACAQTNESGQAEPFKEQQITVFYTDNQLNGLTSESRTIKYKSENEKYKQAIHLLQTPLENNHVSLWPDVRYHSFVVEKGTAIIDMDGSVQYNMGSGAEALAIEALTRTLFQFPEIMAVQILVDGKPAESLAGHIDISEPFTRP